MIICNVYFVHILTKWQKAIVCDIVQYTNGLVSTKFVTKRFLLETALYHPHNEIKKSLPLSAPGNISKNGCQYGCHGNLDFSQKLFMEPMSSDFRQNCLKSKFFCLP